MRGKSASPREKTEVIDKKIREGKSRGGQRGEVGREGNGELTV